MEHQFEDFDDRRLLATIDAALDVLTDERRLRLPSERERMDVLAAALQVSGRLEAWQSRYAAALDRDEAVWHEHGTSTASWLAESHRLTRREGNRLIQVGRRLARFGLIAAAAESGAISPAQADAITSVLEELPDDFDADQMWRAQETMVELAEHHNSTDLRNLTGYLIEVLDPVTAEQREAARLEREHRRAQRNRRLTFTRTGDGSVLFRGSLPVTEGEAFIKVIDAHTAAVQRGLDALDPEAEYVTPTMRRADGLIAMVRAHQARSAAPHHGGDRPRVVVTIGHESLQAMAAEAGYPVPGRLIGTNQGVPASVLRTWLCDAEVLPAVLGGESEVLDVGRAERLVTREIRRALEIRYQGCVFPGCDKPPDACHAHHITPWWAGGATSLTNLVLVCAHHHGIVEPGYDSDADRWRVELGAGGVPRVIPPCRVDPEQRPRIHTRFRRPSRGRRGTARAKTRPERQWSARTVPDSAPRRAREQHRVVGVPSWLEHAHQFGEAAAGHRSRRPRGAGPRTGHTSLGMWRHRGRSVTRFDPVFPGYRQVVLRR
ncbi:MAG: DUF222 domain-containing protein [Propionibacterium sp.]|nr:DUF222 domain-containing protein [Propionibacterium sp.]